MLSSVILGRMSCRQVSRFVEGCGASIDILLSCHTGGNVGIFRRLSTGRYHNASLKKRCYVAGPRYTRPNQFLRHQGLLENWQQYLLAEGVQLNELGLTMYYRSLHRAVIIYSSHNIVGKFTPLF